MCSLPSCFKRIKKKNGFLMIDAVVAVVIISIALVTLIYLYTQGTKASIMAGSSERAMEIAAQRVEFLKKGQGVSYSATNGLGALLTAANTTQTVQVAGEQRQYTATCAVAQVYTSTTSGRNKVYKITVTVGWTDTATESVRLVTYIAVE